MRWLAFALMAFVAVVRADFVPPAEGPVPFRRDKLPLDVDTIGTLSRQVTVLTGAGLPEGAAGLRAAAQMTALALALDPANRDARDLLEKLREGDTPEEADEKELQRTRSRVWQVVGWLEMPEAGTDGQALAACLGDVLVVADPDHPRAKALREAGEKGVWKGWIAPEAAFQKKAPEPEPEPEEDPEPMEEKKAVPVVAMTRPSTSIPLWSMDKESKKMALKMIDIGATVKPGSESGRVEITLGQPMQGDLVTAANGVATALSKRHGGLKGGLVAHLQWTEYGVAVPERNGAVLSGPAATLIDAAITGKTPAAIACVVVNGDGTLQLPPGFWGTLREYASKDGGERIILPMKAADYLTALLVLDHAAFFMNHEVLLAGTVDELCDLASGAPKPALAENFAAFNEIREAGEGKSLGSFVAHPSTQARLNKLGTAMPQHASARLLALQGSGSRPRFLPRAILARTLRDALQPISYVREEPNINQLLSQQLDTIHEECRKKLDELGSVIEIRDRDLQKAAVGVADAVRTLARTIDKEERDYLYESRTKREQLRQATWAEYLRTLKLLTDAAGDAAEFTMPKPLGDR